MNQDFNTTLTELREALTLLADTGLLEGKKVTPEKFWKVLPTIAKRTEKLWEMLDRESEDYISKFSASLELEDQYRDALEAAERATELVKRLLKMKSSKTEARRRHQPGRGAEAERETNLSPASEATLKKLYMYAKGLTDGVDKLAEDLEDVLDAKTFDLFSDYVVEIEEVYSSLRMACRDAGVKGVS